MIIINGSCKVYNFLDLPVAIVQVARINVQSCGDKRGRIIPVGKVIMNLVNSEQLCE